MNSPKYILMDIEGTTTPITFVHDILFPYAYKELPKFIRENIDKTIVADEISNVQTTVKTEQQKTLDVEGAISQLLEWIKSDRKHTALKSLQGQIWQHGYKNGEFQSVVYDDVPASLENWKQRSITLGIYSSGSVAAQKLLFGHTNHGDLNHYFSNYFDTKIGHKRESASYDAIARDIDHRPVDILFLSDIAEELQAAQTAGFQTIQLLRPGTPASPDFRHVNSFLEVL